MMTIMLYIEDSCIKNSNRIRNTTNILHIVWREMAEGMSRDVFLLPAVVDVGDEFYSLFFLRNAIHKNANWTIILIYSDSACFMLPPSRRFTLTCKHHRHHQNLPKTRLTHKLAGDDFVVREAEKAFSRLPHKTFHLHNPHFNFKIMCMRIYCDDEDGIENALDVCCSVCEWRKSFHSCSSCDMNREILFMLMKITPK